MTIGKGGVKPRFGPGLVSELFGAMPPGLQEAAVNVSVDAAKRPDVDIMSDGIVGALPAPASLDSAVVQSAKPTGDRKRLHAVRDPDEVVVEELVANPKYESIL